jgi:hypothetical protein
LAGQFARKLELRQEELSEHWRLARVGETPTRIESLQGPGLVPA